MTVVAIGEEIVVAQGRTTAVAIAVATGPARARATEVRTAAGAATALATVPSRPALTAAEAGPLVDLRRAAAARGKAVREVRRA